MDADQLIQIGLIILALVVVWVIVRAVLRLTMRVFACGCSLILAVAVILVLLRVFGAS